MNDYRFWLGESGLNVNDANFRFVGSVFKPHPAQIIIIANKEKNNCTFDRLQQEEKGCFKVFIKDIAREHIGQRVKFSFNILYPSEGKLLMQTLTSGDKNDLSRPQEIKLPTQ